MDNCSTVVNKIIKFALFSVVVYKNQNYLEVDVYDPISSKN